MEALLDKIYDSQLELEDALALECSLDDARSTDDGRRLVRYIKKRRRIVMFVLNLLEKA